MSNSQRAHFQSAKDDHHFFPPVDSNLSKPKNDVSGSSYEETSDSIAPGGQCSKDSSLSSLWRVSSALASINGIHYNRSSLIKLNNIRLAIYGLGRPGSTRLKTEENLMADVLNEWTDGSLADGYTILYLVELKSSSEFPLVLIGPLGVCTRTRYPSNKQRLGCYCSRYHWSVEQHSLASRNPMRRPERRSRQSWAKQNTTKKIYKKKERRKIIRQRSSAIYCRITVAITVYWQYRRTGFWWRYCSSNVISWKDWHFMIMAGLLNVRKETTPLRTMIRLGTLSWTRCDGRMALNPWSIFLSYE